MAQETAQQKTARDAAERALTTAFAKVSWPTDAFGTPMVKIIAGAAELVPTVQFGNATIGPVIIERFVPDGDEESIKEELKKAMQMVEVSVAEDRQTLHEQIRARS